MPLPIHNQVKSIKNQIDTKFLKDIFGNADNCREYLLLMKKYFPKLEKNKYIRLRSVVSGKHKGELTVDKKDLTYWKQAELSWDYKYSKHVIRELFKNHKSSKTVKVLSIPIISLKKLYGP